MELGQAIKMSQQNAELIFRCGTGPQATIKPATWWAASMKTEDSGHELSEPNSQKCQLRYGRAKNSG